MDQQDIDDIVATIARWGLDEPKIQAVWIYGSWARGTAKPDSDLDVILFCNAPQEWRNETSWALRPEWNGIGLRVSGWSDVGGFDSRWSRSIRFQTGAEIEFTVVDTDWATTAPYPEELLNDVSQSFHVVFDRDGRSRSLAIACAPGLSG